MMYSIPVKLLGQKMQLVLSRHASLRTKERSACDSPESILFSVADLLQNEDVADYILGEVVIGGVAVVVDADNGCSFALQVLQDEIVVNTVFYQEDARRQLRVARDEFTILVKNTKVVFADLFYKMRDTICVLS